MPVLFGATLALGFSRAGAAMANAFSPLELIGIQAFRLPLELFMYRAYLEGIMPQQMSLVGYNLDVVTGILACLIVLYGRVFSVPRWLAWAFNWLGLTLLLVVLAIAIASLPTFAAFGSDRTNTWVARFPYVFLPAIMVPLALMAHLLSFRKLLGPAPTGAPGGLPSSKIRPPG
jgi:hypothetical protein